MSEGRTAIVLQRAEDLRKDGRGLGALYATLGRSATARTALAAAIALYRAMDMTFWLPQVEAALARIV